MQVGLPLAPFTLSSPSLGLLLGTFRLWLQRRRWFIHMSTHTNFYQHFSFPNEHLLPTMGRGTKKLGVSTACFCENLVTFFLCCRLYLISWARLTHIAFLFN
jgi:hypothetical protein